VKARSRAPVAPTPQPDGGPAVGPAGAAAPADPTTAVEVRIHGVGGSTPEALLGEAHDHDVEQVPGSGDAQCGVWCRRRDPDTQGFVWGRLTSQSPYQALWIVLFPFTLLNAAGWMHRRVTDPKDHTVTAVRVVVRILGVLLTATWVLWLGVIIVDLLAHQAARDLRLIGPRPRVGLATLAVIAVMGGLCVVARSTQRRFEHHRPASGTDRAPRRPLNDHETLTSPAFFDHSTDSYRLLLEHAVVIAAVAAFVGWQAWQRAGDGPTLGYGGAITGLVAVQFAFLGVLFLLTAFPLDWRRGWRVAGPAVVATVALMVSNGFFAGLALFLRRSLKVDHLPLGSEMAFLDVYSLVVLGSLLFAACGWLLPFLLGRDDADDVPDEWRARVGRRRRIARAFRHVDLPISAAGLAMLVAGAAVASQRINRIGWKPWDWSVATGGRVRWAETIGATVLPLAAMAVPALIRRSARNSATRRNVGNVWDVLSFWPRRFHPLAVRPYSERAVPILQDHIARLLKANGRVVVSAHSQGSVLAYAALAGLQAPDMSPSWRSRVDLVTYGSPLSRLHARFFPHYFHADDYVRARRAFWSWHNFYRLTDHIGQAVFDTSDVPDPADHVLPDPAGPPPATAGDADAATPPREADRTAGDVLAGHNSYRNEPALKAHVRRCRQGRSVNPPPPTQPEFRPRRRMVSWFDPRLLAMTGFNAVSAEFFRTYLDKRDIEVLLCEKTPIEPPEGDQPVSIDYVADLGDAFDPTYAIAWHLAKERLRVRDDSTDGGDLELRRGRILVMGGDEVYPAPTTERYRNQTVGPYSVALPGPPGADSPQLLVMPGNHDWYDGLTLFLAQFSTEPSIGGWRTPQSRSYFAVPLRPGWWLWGLDAGLGGQIDAPQRAYFEELRLTAGSHLILCWCVPTWTKEPRKPGGHALLQTFVRDVVEKRHRSDVALYVTGDSHYFAHHVSAETGEHWITAGGGGAFLHPTHNLSRSLSLPAAEGTTTTLQLEDRWPGKRESRGLLWRLLLFPRYNPTFAGFMGFVHVLLAWGVQGGLRQPSERAADALANLSWSDVWEGFISNPFSTVLGILLVAGFSALAIPPRREKRHRYRLVGVVHGAAHLGLALMVIRGASAWLSPKPGTLFTLAFLAKVAVAGGLLSGVLVGLYLAITNLTLKMHDNEAFSALHLKGYKHFLRMEITEDRLTVRVIGLKKVGRRWGRVPATVERPPCARPSDVRPTCVATIEIPVSRPSLASRRSETGEPPPAPAFPNGQPAVGVPGKPPAMRPGWSTDPCPPAAPAVVQPTGSPKGGASS
jgi:hypothetical protein